MKKLIIILVFASIGTFGAIYLKTRFLGLPPKNDAEKIQVVASFYPLAYFAELIGGEKVTVVNITPAGAEPHDYEPTTRDVQAIDESNVLILNGAGLESWSGKIENKNILTVSDGMSLRTLTENGEQLNDPHIWLDPVLSKTIVEKIAHELESLSPTDTAYFETNKAVLMEKLELLNTEFKNGLGNCRASDIVTSHAAFGYLSARYNFTQVAVSGISPDDEPTPKKLSEVSKLIKEKGLQYIFFETLVSPRLAETIATETNAQTLVFNPLEGLTNDELVRGENYFSIQRNNLMNLRTALSCM